MSPRHETNHAGDEEQQGMGRRARGSINRGPHRPPISRAHSTEVEQVVSIRSGTALPLASGTRETPRSPERDWSRGNTAYMKNPLINYAKNDWRYVDDGPPTMDPKSFSLPPSLTPKLRRNLTIYFVILCACFAGWRYWLRPQWEERQRLYRMIDDQGQVGQGLFGSNARPEFSDMIQLESLHEALVPKCGKHYNGKEKTRLIVVGDIHGCRVELENLLKKVSFNKKTDHLIAVGDTIAKGPDSPGVIDLLMSNHASCVRGNHEDRILLAHSDIITPHVPLPGPNEDPLRAADDLEEESFSKGDYRDRRVAGGLNEKHIKYLKKCPVILRIGPIEGLGEVVVVHAGLVPGVTYERQDPFGVMNMRTIDVETNVPSSSSEGVPWSKLYNQFQSRLSSSKRSTVIYGHDARTGLNLRKYTKGIDSGCVRGGKLTALIIEGGSYKASVTHVSVKCADRRGQKAKIEEEEKAAEGSDGIDTTYHAPEENQ